MDTPPITHERSDHRSTGADKKLVGAAVQWARVERVKIIPLCPFAKSVFDKTPQFADVLAR